MDSKQDIDNMRRVLRLTQEPRIALEELCHRAEEYDAGEAESLRRIVDTALDKIEEHASDVYHNMMRQRRSARGVHVPAWE